MLLSNINCQSRVTQNICMNDRCNNNILQNNITNRVTSQIAFKGGNPLNTAIVRDNFNNISKSLKLFFIRTFCKPSNSTINSSCKDMYNMFYLSIYDLDNNKITKILRMLDIYSKNQEYSAFVKEGIEFLKRVHAGKNGERAKFYTKRTYDLDKIHGTCWCAGDDGRKLISAIQLALKKAIRPNSKADNNSYYLLYPDKVDNSFLRESILVSKKIISEFFPDIS